MPDRNEEKFLSYYHRELSYLRNAGQQFAARYPQVAQRLDFSKTGSSDPHLERLLESFAFLTARISQSIDDRLPEIATALLGVLHPELISPTPAMAIACFDVDPSQGKLTSGQKVPMNTSLFAITEDEVMCRFKTAYPTTLWPIQVASADFVHGHSYDFKGTEQRPWYLKLSLRAVGLNFSELELSSLRFFIHADRVSSFSLYEAIFAQKKPQVLVSQDHTTVQELPAESFSPVGFEDQDAVLPASPHGHSSYRLVQEYFHFPEKFLFFDVKNLKLDKAESTVDLLISLGKHHVVEHIPLTPSMFLLGCTPIINLFEKTTDPIRIDHRKTDYLLLADQRQDRTTEIHTILGMEAVDDHTAKANPYRPFFSFEHDDPTSDDPVFWVAKRVPSHRKEVPGTDIYVSFVDLKLNPKLPPHQTAYARTLCTNRFLAEEIPAGAALQIEDRLPVVGIRCLDKPTPQTYQPVDGETLWKLISQLSINHLSLTKGKISIQALKEALNLYSNRKGGHSQQEISHIQSLEATPITRRIGDQAWRGFIQGLKVTIKMSDKLHSGDSSFLLASVLRYFFGLQVSINSFVQLNLVNTNTNQEWMEWNPLSGQKIIL